MRANSIGVAALRQEFCGRRLYTKPGGRDLLVRPSWTVPQLYEEIGTFDASNAWTSTEVQFIAMGAGWIKGITMSDKGISRPPLASLSKMTANQLVMVMQLENSWLARP